MKTILYNSVYVNPYAYNVFPQLAYPEKEEENFVESCKIVGQLDILNLNDGTIDTYKQVNSIDFSKYAGSRIEISQYTKDGAVLLGEWLIPGEVTPPYTTFMFAGIIADNKMHSAADKINPEGETLDFGYVYSWVNDKVADITVETSSVIPNHTEYTLTKLEPKEIGDPTHSVTLTIGPNTEPGTVYPIIKLTQDISNTWISFMYTQEKQVVAEGNVGDICLYDKANDKLIIVANDDFSAEKYPLDSYSSVGVVVIPKSHNVYGDGSCGVMSLKEMNYNSPDDGSISRQNMYWGGYGDDISLPNLNQIPTGNTSNGIPTGQTSYAYLPSDKFSGTQCAHDTDAYYYFPIYIPSPYLTDGSRNPGYYQTTSPSSLNNALADFDGIGNSQVLWDLATSQSSWKTASSITNNSGSGYYPAACCCWRYHTEGTNQGDWYLPACGELSYIMPPFNKINDAIGKMRTAYGSSVGVELGTGDDYWSSSEYSSDNARSVNTNYGYMYGLGKNFGIYVRAFLRVNNNTDNTYILIENDKNVADKLQTNIIIK